MEKKEKILLKVVKKELVYIVGKNQRKIYTKYLDCKFNVTHFFCDVPSIIIQKFENHDYIKYNCRLEKDV